jgi:protein-tyrosine kinase
VKLYDASRMTAGPGLSSSTRQEPTRSEGSAPDPAHPAQLNAYKVRRESHIEAAMEMYATEEANKARLNASLTAAGGNSTSIPPVARDSDTQSGMQVGEALITPHAPVQECYEALKANLWIRFPDKSMKVVLLVGAAKGCGVSTAATNFAASLAQDSGTRVLLVDANVRSPKQFMFAATSPSEAGAGSSLERLLSDASAWQYPAGTSNLFVLGAKCSMSVFRSEVFDGFLHKVRELFDYIVVDAPPLASHPETLLLSQKADGVILVIESEKTRTQSALWAKKQIETAGGKLLGVVLNKRRHRIPKWLYKRI